MNDQDQALHRVNRLMVQAESDLRAAGQILTDGGPPATACWHAQQAMIAYLRSLLLYQAIPLPPEEDLAELLSRFPEALGRPLEDEELRSLSAYVLGTLHPDDGSSIRQRDAVEAF